MPAPADRPRIHPALHTPRDAASDVCAVVVTKVTKELCLLVQQLNAIQHSLRFYVVKHRPSTTRLMIVVQDAVFQMLFKGRVVYGKWYDQPSQCLRSLQDGITILQSTSSLLNNL